jgi:hypothetical protein
MTGATVAVYNCRIAGGFRPCSLFRASAASTTALRQRQPTARRLDGRTWAFLATPWIRGEALYRQGS